MICKKLSVVALSGLTAALSLSAMAQDTMSSTTSSSGMMTGSMSTDSSMGTMSGSMSMQPMVATGTVLRYYTDRSGYVTAMDVQTAEGVRMVRFSPGMGQRLYSTYPVGGQITGMVQPSMMGSMQRLDLVALGDTPPAAGMMTPYMASDIELLRSQPFIQAGSKLVQFKGRLKSVVPDDRGEILALVLDKTNMAGMMGMGGMAGGMMNAGMTTDGMTATTEPVASTTTSTSGSTSTDATGATTTTTTTDTTTVIQSGTATSTGMMMSNGMMMGADTILVRVPPELRHPGGAQMAGSERVTPLFPGAEVEVVGYVESPRYGVISAYGQRVAANALVLNGRAVGAVGLPRVQDKRSALLSLNIGGTSAEEQTAMGQGYSTYGMTTSGGGMSGGMMSDPSMTTGTTGATGGTGTGGNMMGSGTGSTTGSGSGM